MSEPHFDSKQVECASRRPRSNQTKDNQPREGQPRVVKKYPNRRLYDTVESRYITLADIRRLVMDKIDFIVIDKKSQETSPAPSCCR